MITEAKMKRPRKHQGAQGPVLSSDVTNNFNGRELSKGCSGRQMPEAKSRRSREKPADP